MIHFFFVLFVFFGWRWHLEKVLRKEPLQHQIPQTKTTKSRETHH